VAAKRPKAWPPEGKLRDDRLVYLAAEPELIRRATPWWMHIARFQVSPRSSREASSSHRSMQRGRMHSYVMATQRAAERLNPMELEAVRRDGVLPDWFYEEVEEQRRNARRR
jgi:hypothetical protein